MAIATRPRRPVTPAPPPLTRREQEVARLLRYYKDEEIAALLGISHSRVRQLQEQIKKKVALPPRSDRWVLVRHIRDNNLE